MKRQERWVDTEADGISPVAYFLTSSAGTFVRCLIKQLYIQESKIFIVSRLGDDDFGVRLFPLPHHFYQKEHR